MTRAEFRAHALTLGTALALVILVLGAQGFVDRMERDAEDRINYRQWVADACIPSEGQSAIATHDGGKLKCTLYSQRGYGLATEVVSAAVMEVPL